MYTFIDIGGTNTRISIVSTLDDISLPIIFETLKDPEDAYNHLKDILLEHSKNQEYSHIVIGLPGIVDYNGDLYHAPNLKKWEKYPIKKRLENEFFCKVYVENDAALVALGEAVYGAGKNGYIVGYITISTGVGGARIVGKEIDCSNYTFEPGKMIVGKRTIESLISGNSFIKRFHTSPKNINSNYIWENEAKHIGELLATTVAFWSPDTIVIGGPMVQNIPLSRIDKYMRTHLSYLPKYPKLYKSNLGQYGGLWGGLAYLRQKIKLN